MTGLSVRTASGGGWEAELPPGGGAPLPDEPALIGWFAGVEAPAPDDRLRVDGRELVRRGPVARLRAGLVVVGDPPLAPAVSVVDHLAAGTSMRRARQLLAATPHLARRAGDPAGILSGGERRLLGWTRAVLLGPRVVVLDRAGTGLDTVALAWATEQVGRWRANGAIALVRVGRAEEGVWTEGRAGVSHAPDGPTP